MQQKDANTQNIVPSKFCLPVSSASCSNAAIFSALVSWGRVCARHFHSCWLVALLIALLVLAELPSTAKITAYY
jgi:hypothetical protein